jgi:hypothetical protein
MLSRAFRLSIHVVQAGRLICENAIATQTRLRPRSVTLPCGRRPRERGGLQRVTSPVGDSNPCFARRRLDHSAPRPSSCKRRMTRPRSTAGADRARGRHPNTRRRRDCVIHSPGARGPPPPSPRADGTPRPRLTEPFSRPQLSEPTAPFAPVNPSASGSGVLHFVPPLRVTAAKPGEGGEADLVTAGVVRSPNDVPLPRAPSLLRQRPHIEERPPSPWGGLLKPAAGRAVSPFRTAVSLAWRCGHGRSSIRGGGGGAGAAGSVGAAGGGSGPVFRSSGVGHRHRRGRWGRSVRA